MPRPLPPILPGLPQRGTCTATARAEEAVNAAEPGESSAAAAAGRSARSSAIAARPLRIAVKVWAHPRRKAASTAARSALGRTCGSARGPGHARLGLLLGVPGSAATSFATASTSRSTAARCRGSARSCSTQFSVPSYGPMSSSTSSCPSRIPTRMSRERPEREQVLRRGDQPLDLRATRLDLLDDPSDGLVDQRNPDALRRGHLAKDRATWPWLARPLEPRRRA